MRRITLQRKATAPRTIQRSLLSPAIFHLPPKRVFREPPLSPDPAELSALRDRLIETRNFSNLTAYKLVALHGHTSEYVQTCIAAGQSVRAREAKALCSDLEYEMRKQSRALAQQRIQIRSRDNSSGLQRKTFVLCAVFELNTAF